MSRPPGRRDRPPPTAAAPRRLAAAAIAMGFLVAPLAQATAQSAAPTSPEAQIGAASAEGGPLADLSGVVDEVLALIADLRRRNAAIETRAAELADLLAMERETTGTLRDRLAALSADLEGVLDEREDLAFRLETILAAREAYAERAATLLSERDAAAARADALGQDLAEARRTIEGDRETIEAQKREMASLGADIRALREVRERLEGEVAALAAKLKARDEEAAALNDRIARIEAERERVTAALTAARDRTKKLEARLSTAEERTALAQTEIEAREVRIAEIEAALRDARAELANEKTVTRYAERQLDFLNQQIAELRRELRRLNAALDASESENREQALQLANLEGRLKQALASKVEELARYRSEFFGRLREVLGTRPDIRVVGDRFVFQSEVLFATGSAEVGSDGRAQLARLADTLLEIAGRIPADLNWVLQVNGHTDRRPIATPEFPSNWELSAARAISVVKFLIQQGVPPTRLVAAGFGEHQPLDPRDDEIAYRRNRRIELKLTQRSAPPPTAP